ncbi:nickel transporter [Streptomyces sp. JJ38]|nr:nickel transporter [Streptomyces sp. JJ38]
MDTTLVVDRAELAAAQERTAVDTDSDGTSSAPERERYAARQCDERARDLHVTVADSPRITTVTSATFTYRPGEAGLRTSRLECALHTPADLATSAEVSVTDSHQAPRIGWHELTAVGDGVTLTDSTAPTKSVTDELRQYPDDLLMEPLDQRSATLSTEPGSATGEGPGTAAPALPELGPISSAYTALSDFFTDLVGRRELTLPVGLLALSLAVVLGASHAVLPGHGKTVMAAYLAGRRGRAQDAVTVGATVTVTHTAGVLAVGLLLPVVTSVAGETVLGWLTLASGLLVTAIGLSLLSGALRGRTLDHHHHHSHGHHHPHDHDHHPGHSHGPGHDRSHGGAAHPAEAPSVPRSRAATASQTQPGTVAVLTKTTPATPEHHGHQHAHPHRHPHPGNRRGLIGIGIAGGLVPSPSALVVLLGAIALGRTPFGILLVLGYGLGMAATLTAAGILLVRFRDHAVATWSSRLPENALVRRISRLGAPLTATLVVLVGLGLTIRALIGAW